MKIPSPKHIPRLSSDNPLPKLMFSRMAQKHMPRIWSPSPRGPTQGDHGTNCFFPLSIQPCSQCGYLQSSVRVHATFPAAGADVLPFFPRSLLRTPWAGEGRASTSTNHDICETSSHLASLLPGQPCYLVLDPARSVAIPSCNAIFATTIVIVTHRVPLVLTPPQVHRKRPRPREVDHMVPRHGILWPHCIGRGTSRHRIGPFPGSESMDAATGHTGRRSRVCGMAGRITAATTASVVASIPPLPNAVSNICSMPTQSRIHTLLLFYHHLCLTISMGSSWSIHAPP